MYLRECVESVLGQSHRDLAVLILDDASTDQTEWVARELADRDGRVEFRRHATNKKNILTYNEGLEWASGDYTLLLSADDLITPGALGRAVGLLDAHPEVGFVYGKTIRFETDGPRTPVRPPSEGDLPRIVPGLEWLESVCREGMHPIHSPEIVVRTRLQHELGGYRPELPYSGDMEMWMRFASHADVGVLDADQAYYRIHPSNMSRDIFEDMSTEYFRAAMRDFTQRKAAFDLLFEHFGGRIEDRERLRSLANHGLAWNAFWTAHREFQSGNLTNCQLFLDFALELYPDLNSRPEWVRLRWKRLLGPMLWSRLDSFASRMGMRHGRARKGLT